MTIDQLVFVGFSKRVVALHRDTGALVWEWKASNGTSYASLLLDGDRLIVSVQGYTYCLDPLTGTQLWFNPLKGMGIGVASLASTNGSSSAAWLMAAAAQTAEQHSNAS